MVAKRYPKATWKGDGKTAGAYTSGPFKVVLHTTETRGVPSYDGGMSAPHLTYNPKTRVWVQHTELTTAARALRNAAGGAETNRDSALQVEIICYSDRFVADRVLGLWVGDLSSAALGDIRDFIDWTGVPLVWPGRQARNYAEANAPGFRLSQAVWGGYAGVVGHQHVPENTHWDPGMLDWETLLGDDMALLLTEAEQLQLRRFLNNIEAAGSNVDFVTQSIQDIRERNSLGPWTNEAKVKSLIRATKLDAQ